MTAFILVAVVMTAVAVAAVLWPLLRRRTHASRVQQAASNVQLIRDQLKELERERESGALTEDRYAESRAELERRVIEESVEERDALRGGVSFAPVLTAALVPVVIVVAAGLLYWKLGSPTSIGVEQAAAQAPQHDFSPEQIEAMVTRLAQKLEQNPNDARGWSILARTYYSLQRFPEAARAFEQLLKLEPNDVDAIADYADALAMSQDRVLAGKPMELVRQALRIDPNHPKALAMAGSAAFDRRDYKTALLHWEKLQKLVPPDSPFGQSVAASIAEARQLAGMPAPKAAAAGSGSVKVVISLSPALAAQARPDDTVFIFARPSQGPKMPLAVVRKLVSELPATVTLDDTLAMSPAMKLSSFAQVVIGARVSKTATAAPQSGDLEGLSPPVNVGASDVKVVIDRVLP